MLHGLFFYLLHGLPLFNHDVSMDCFAISSVAITFIFTFVVIVVVVVICIIVSLPLSTHLAK
jgi:hypothetical protein